ncbi:MAG: hypothetical protein QM607_08995 [Microbacterium sp.]
MILGFTIVEVAVASVAGLLCVILGLAKRPPSDLSVGATLLVELLLIAQIVVSIVAPFVGNSPSGDLLEFWAYLISAALLPAGGIVWAFVDRTRWSVVVMGVLCLAVAFMTYRMHVIWTAGIA